jgi:hypothetical protein
MNLIYCKEVIERINESDGQRRPIHYACWTYGMRDVFEELLKINVEQAPCQSDGASLLHYAVVGGDYEIVKKLL